jgi:polyisoprenoid-binding protein YceI
MRLTFQVDPNHTTVGFTAKHMMVTTVHGKFKEWAGTVEADEDNPLSAVVSGTIKAASVESGLEMRDKDVREKILDAENYPEITYRSTRVEAAGDKKYRVTGDLTIAGKTHPITLDVETEDEFTDVMGFHRVGFSARGTLRRSDWQLTWNYVLEGGRVLVSEEVKIEIDGAFVRKVEKPAEAKATA